MKAKTFSRLLVLLLTMTMVLSLFPAAAFAADEVAEPCTITQGCILADGHEGECELAEEAPAEPKASPEAPEAEPEVTPEAEPETTPEAEPEVTPEAEPEATPEAEPEVTPEAEPEATPEAEPEATPEAEPETTPEAEPEASPEVAAEANGPVSVSDQEGLQAALNDAANNGGVIVLANDITINSNLYIGATSDKADTIIADYPDVSIDLGGHSITRNAGAGPNEANSMFRIYSTAMLSITNGKLINNGAEGRCVDTRVAANVVLTGVEITAKGGGNTQPITIAGSAPGTKILLEGCKVDAGAAGYAIIDFINNAAVTVNNSRLEGYAVVYAHSNNSTGSTFNFNGTEIITVNEHTLESKSSFAAFAIDTPVTVNISGGSIYNTTTNTAPQWVFSISGSGNGTSVNVSDSTTITQSGENAMLVDVFVDGSDLLSANTIRLPSTCADQLKKEGLKLVDGRVVPMINNEARLRAAVELGGEVTLDGDLDGDLALSEPLVIPAGKGVNLHLNGHTLSDGNSFNGDSLIIVDNGAALSINEAEGGNGKISSSVNGIKMTRSETYDDSKTAELVVNGGTIEAKSAAIIGNGTRHNTSITVNGGTLKGEGGAIYHPQNGKVEIKGGTLTGGNFGIEMRAGELTVEGGSITATSGDFSIEAGGSGSTTSGVAVAVVPHKGSTVKATITGGELNGKHSLHEEVLEGYEGEVGLEVSGGKFEGEVFSENEKEFISGGSFSDASAGKYAPDGFDAVEGSDGRFTIDKDTTRTEEDQAEINGQFFNSLQNAFDAAKNGETVKLQKDITDEQATITVDGSIIRSLDLASAEISTVAANGKTVTFDLNGKTLKVKRFEATNGAELIIIDSTATAAPSLNGTDVSYQSGRITTVGEYDGTVAMGGSTITLKSGTVESTANSGLCAGPGSTVNVEGGYVVSQEFAISPLGSGATVNMKGGIAESRDNAVIAGNGNGQYGGTVVNISGGILLAKIQTEGYASCGVYHPQEGTLNITDGEIISTNGCGILMRSGTLNISGGTVTAQGDEGFTGKVGDSRIVVPTSGIVFDRDADYPAVSGTQLNIKGGMISGSKSAVELIDTQDVGGKDKIEVSGGSFSDASIEPFLPEGNAAVKGEDGRYTIGLADTAVAEVNGRAYNSLQAALDAAKQGETVKLLKDVSENVKIAEGKDIILELNGFTIDGGTTKGQAALTNYGKVTIQDSSTAQSGGIKRGDTTKDGCYYTIKNEGEMTIAGGKVYNHAGGDSINPWSGSSLVCNGQEKPATLNITGGVLSQDNFICVKNDDYGTLNVTGGTLISNDQAVQNWNQASITGGNIQGAVGTWSYDGKTSSTSIGGSAVVEGDVYANNYKGNGAGSNVNITGGRINGELRLNTNSDCIGDNNDINVSGGSFKHPVEDQFCADGFVPVQNPDGSYGVATEGADITIVLSLDLTGGQGTVTSLSATVKAGEEASFTLPNEKPVKQFHKFLGWSTNKDYKAPVTRAVDPNTLYQPGETITTALNVQLYAIWEKLPTHVITLTYNANGGWRAPDPQSAEVVVGEYVDFVTTQQKPYRFGYVFQGWSFSPDGKLAVRPGQTVRASADTTLYAVWALPTDSPLTGDNSNLGLWLGLMGGSLVCIAAAAVIIIKKRKK